MKVSYIRMTWPELEKSVAIEPISANGVVFDWMAEQLPIEVVQSHAVVSGELMYALNLPLKNVPDFDYRDLTGDDLSEAPIGRAWVFATFGRVGSLMVKYGDDLTEPMSYPSFGQVREADLDELRHVGAAVWDAIYNTKRIVRLIVETV